MRFEINRIILMSLSEKLGPESLLSDCTLFAMSTVRKLAVVKPFFLPGKQRYCPTTCTRSPACEWVNGTVREIVSAQSR